MKGKQEARERIGRCSSCRASNDPVRNGQRKLAIQCVGGRLRAALEREQYTRRALDAGLDWRANNALEVDILLQFDAAMLSSLD